MTTVYIGHELGRRSSRHLCRGRNDDGLVGVSAFHEIVAKHAKDPADVVIASETDLELFVTALIAAGMA